MEHVRICWVRCDIGKWENGDCYCPTIGLRDKKKNTSRLPALIRLKTLEIIRT